MHPKKTLQLIAYGKFSPRHGSLPVEKHFIFFPLMETKDNPGNREIPNCLLGKSLLSLFI